MGNPEIQFRSRFQPDYTGMDLTEEIFCRMEDHTGTLRDYSLDIITSAGSRSSQLPVILFIHGGGFIEPCDKRQSYISLFARTLTQKGYAVVSPDYPLFADSDALEKAGGEPAGYQKASAAVHLAYQYIQKHAARLGFDPHRIAIIGGSAGGWASFYAVPQDHYKALINLWGVPQILPDLSGFPPVFSVHGTADCLVPYEREAALQQGLEQHHIPHSLISLKDSGHTPLNRLEEFLPAMVEWLNTYLNE